MAGEGYLLVFFSGVLQAGKRLFRRVLVCGLNEGFIDQLPYKER